MKKERYDKILAHMDTDEGLEELRTAWRNTCYSLTICDTSYFTWILVDPYDIRFYGEYSLSRGPGNSPRTGTIPIIIYPPKSPRELLQNSQNFAQFVTTIRVALYDLRDTCEN
jgi:hypothetical protein